MKVEERIYSIWSSTLFKFVNFVLFALLIKHFYRQATLQKDLSVIPNCFKTKSLVKHTMFPMPKSKKDFPKRCIQWAVSGVWWAWKEMRRWTVKVGIRPSSRPFHLDNPDQSSNKLPNGTVIDPYRICLSILH